MKAIYTSVFDDFLFCSSTCEYDPITKLVTDIEDSDIEANTNALTDEYVTLEDGTELRAIDGIVFEY